MGKWDKLLFPVGLLAGLAVGAPLKEKVDSYLKERAQAARIERYITTEQAFYGCMKKNYPDVSKDQYLLESLRYNLSFAPLPYDNCKKEAQASDDARLSLTLSRRY